MAPGGAPAPHSGRRTAAAVVAAAVLVMGLVWGLGRPARQLLPSADLYTHLSVARHLVRGEGYLTDCAYPLSFAYPFACALPQPLIHRMPGFGTLLTVPWLLSGQDADRAVAAVRFLQIALVLVIVALGSYTLARRGSVAGVPFWLILLGTSPLLGFAVDWGQDEVLTGALLLAGWVHLRRGSGPSPLFIGTLAGLLGLVRLELLWVPMVWWVALAPRGQNGPGRSPGFGLMLAMAAVVLIPWSLRNLELTGQPFFTLQSVAEAAKDTQTFPGYSVYQGLAPQPVLHFAAEHIEPLARKTARGLRFYIENAPGFLAWPWWLVILASTLLPRLRCRGLMTAGGTALLMMILYVPFDHSLRHLLPLFPVLAWELAAFATPAEPSFTGRRTALRGLILAGAAAVAALVFPCRLPGWESAARNAEQLQEQVRLETSRLRRAPPGVAFTPYAAATWYADRAAVWDPMDARVRQRIILLYRNHNPSSRAGGRVAIQ